MLDRNKEIVPNYLVLEPKSTMHVPYDFSYHLAEYFPYHSLFDFSDT